MTKTNNAGYAFPVAANPGTVHFLTLSMEERKKRDFCPAYISDADRYAAAKILEEREKAAPAAKPNI